MRILQFGKFFPPDLGGIETVMHTLTNGLNRLGVVSDVLCSNSTSRTEVATSRGYRVIRAASFGKVFSTAISPALIYWLFKIHKQYDVIHVHMPDPLAMLAILLCRPRAKIVLHWHGDVDFSKFKWLSRLYRPLDRMLAKRADRVIGATTAHIAYSSNCGLFAGKNEIIPFPLDPSFDGCLHSPTDPDLMALAKNRYIIFAVGRLIYYKGFEYLIAAAASLPRDCLVIIGGGGPLEKELRMQINKLGLEDKVILVGKVSDARLREYYSICSVYCFPSIYRGEMFGMVQIEAMSFGKPVISTRIPASGVAEVNLDGVTGRVVPLKNAKALADAILELKNNPVVYEKMSFNARSRALDFYGCETVIPLYVKLYSRVLAAA